MQNYSKSSQHLCSGLLEISDQIVSLAFFLQTGKHHLGSRDVLLRIFQVNKECVLDRILIRTRDQSV